MHNDLEHGDYQNATGATNALLIELCAEIVGAYVSHNALGSTDLPKMINDVYRALAGLGGAHQEVAALELRPAVPVKKSVTPDHLVCLEDGQHFKSLKRHLQTEHGMSPDEYRTKWGLPSDYPMVAPRYSEARSKLAKSIGLGRKPTAPAGRRGSRG